MNDAIHDGTFWAATTVVLFVVVGVGRFLTRMIRSIDRLEAKVDDLSSEFPKNGVPTRAAIDVIKQTVADVKNDVVELKASHEAHLMMLHGRGSK